MNTYKLVYKFLEIDRLDIVITHLRAALRQPESLNVRERRKLADVLLNCYVTRLAKSTSSSKAGVYHRNEDLVEEFYKFLETSSDYNHDEAVKLLLSCGMIKDTFKIWEYRGCDVGNTLSMLLVGGYVELGQRALDEIQKIIQQQRNSKQEIQQQLDILFSSPLFAASPADTQVRVCSPFPLLTNLSS